MKTIRLLMLLGVVGFSIALAQAQDAKTILQKVDDVVYGPKDSKRNVKMIITNKNGKKKEREAISLQKGTDKNLFRFTSPASQAGISTLSLPNDVMYLYLPAFGKERRISSSVKNQKFAGTDFSYDDMEAKRYSEKYTPKLLKTEDDTLVLELIPMSKKTDYSKLIMTVNKTNYCPIEVKYYDRRGQEMKIATFKFEKIGKYWNTKEILMRDLKANSSTLVITSDVQFDTGLSDDEFTVRKLKQ